MTTFPPIYTCPVEIRPASFHVDPEPAEYCDREVAEDGECCPLHGGPEERDWDAERKDEERDA